MSGTPVMDVAAALVFRGGRLLITQRLPGATWGGFWEFPGGKREAGETWEEALQRELREELDFDVDVGRTFAEIVHEQPDKTLRLRFLICVPRSAGNPEPRPIGCADLAWVTAAELGNYTFPPADSELLRQLPAAPEFSAGSAQETL